MAPKSSTDHDIKVLNSLITTTLDSADGYREAAKDTKNPTFKDLFGRWSSERQQVASELQQEVSALGGKPQDEGSALASAHRIFVNLRDAMSRSDKGVVEEVERGEDYLKSKYEEALDDDDLSEQIRPLISRAYESVVQGHDQARDLKQHYQRN